MKTALIMISELFVVLVLMFTNSSVSAQHLTIASGSEKGVYYLMTADMINVCGSVLPMQNIVTKGSAENIEKLTRRGTIAGWVQTDVVWLESKDRDLGRIYTLLAMHPEVVHVVALASGKKEGGFAGFGGTTTVLTDVAQLAGKKVGASGGSIYTARVIKLQGEVNYEVVEYRTNDEALVALKGGQVDAVVMVGGVPLPGVQALGQSYRLLQVNDITWNRLEKSGVYKKTKVSYSELTGSNGIQAATIDALLLVRDLQTPRYTELLSKFRSCVAENIAELKEGDGKTPAWEYVDLSNKGRWQYYEMPVVKYDRNEKVRK